MLAYAQNSKFSDSDIEIFSKLQAELIERYQVDEKLASEMAWDLLEVLSAVEGDLEIFEKYFLQ